MNWELLFDPLFRLPFLTGLLVSAVLPLLGLLLRLRDEWLAALGLAHLAGFGALLGLSLGLPVFAGAALAAAGGVLVRTWAADRGNSAYAMMMLFGWSATLVVATNTPLGSAMGHALVEGQLYFAGAGHLAVAVVMALAVAVMLPRIMSGAVRATLFPETGATVARANRRTRLALDGLVVLAIAAGSATVGLMAAFALVFLPPWLAFRVARSWRQALWLAPAVGVSAFVLAFVLAVALDQPFAPVQVAVLLLFAMLGGWVARSG